MQSYLNIWPRLPSVSLAFSTYGQRTSNVPGTYAKRSGTKCDKNRQEKHADNLYFISEKQPFERQFFNLNGKTGPDIVSLMLCFFLKKNDL